MLSTWYWHAMLRRIHMTINNVVFATHQHARRSIETVRRRQLTTWNLDKQICPWICRLTPFAYNMIQTQVKLVVCEHLGTRVSCAGTATDTRTHLFRVVESLTR